MELKVWVEGIQRIVCGVTEVTTCRDVVCALAHATGKTGRFALMERWRNSERLLAPHEHPLKILLKWGECASDVQFILQRTALEPKSEYRQESKLVQSYPPSQRPSQSIPGGSQGVSNKGPASVDPSGKSTPQSPLQSGDIKKSLTFSGGHSSHAPISAEGISPEVGAHPPQGYIPKLSPLSHPHSSYPPVHQESSMVTGHPRYQYPPNTSSRSLSINRPPAPPPYELVRGHPPPPPPTGGSMHARYPYATSSGYGAYSQQKEWRNPLPPPPPPPQPSSVVRPPQPTFPPYRASPPNPGYARPQRELPPYRDPPPPPPPSHPALMKISPPKGNHSHSSSAHPEGSPALKSFDKDKYLSGSSKGSDSPWGEASVSSQGKERVERLHGVSRESVPLGQKMDEPVGVFSNQMPSNVVDKSKKEDLRRPKEKEDGSVDEGSKFKSDRPISPLKSGQRETTSDSADANDNNLIQSDNSSVNLTKGLSPEGDKNVVQSIIKQLVKTSNKDISSLSGNNNNNNHSTEEVIVDGYYRELVKLVNQQREKISAQQIDLTKFEAEIAFTEGRRKEEESRLAYIQEEIQRLEKLDKNPEKPVDLKLLNQLEEQLKAMKIAEGASVDDVAALKKKVVNCDQKLAQMNARVRSIEEALRQEELTQQQKAQEAFQEEEQEALRREIEKLQLAVEQATQQAEHTQSMSKQLSQEMHEAEDRLEEKRKEIEALKHAMREANLEALSMSPPDEAKALTESRAGSTKSGTIRRMVGSPRQLETAVPTSKNPHGVWV